MHFYPRYIYYESQTNVPLDISAFSVRPPHRESVTSGRSLAESERHSVPLSAAALPTDWGDWEPECISESIQCFVAASDSLTTQKRTTRADGSFGFKIVRL